MSDEGKGREWGYMESGGNLEHVKVGDGEEGKEGGRCPDYPAILERERTLVAEGVTAIKKAIDGREWLTEGRGSYEWDDDRWHSEFAAAISEILTALKPLEKVAADWSNCPQKWEDVQKARAEAESPVAPTPELKYWVPPFRLVEPETDNQAANIMDSKGNLVAMMFWPTHPVEETAEAEQATYHLGRLFATAAQPPAQTSHPTEKEEPK